MSDSMRITMTNTSTADVQVPDGTFQIGALMDDVAPTRAPSVADQIAYDALPQATRALAVRVLRDSAFNEGFDEGKQEGLIEGRDEANREARDDYERLERERDAAYQAGYNDGVKAMTPEAA
jgi:hypothetical protein